MDFTFSDEQRQLREAVHSYLKRYPGPHGRDCFDGTGHRDRWISMAGDLGLGTLAIPTEHGGLGGDPVDTMIVMESFGEALVIEPFIETVVIAGRLIAGSRRDQLAGDLQLIADGSHRYSLAHSEHSGREPVTVRREGDKWRLRGMKSMAAAAPWAERLIVTALHAESPDPAKQLMLFVAERDAPGLSMDAFATIDGRCAADLHFDDVLLDHSALLHPGGVAVIRLEEALDAARAAQAAEAIGIMRRMLQDTIGYTLERRQFGKALADFQVSRHRMTDMAMQIETATSALYLGTLKLGAEPTERARSISTMAVVVAKALRFVGQYALQLHGGMGMTNEVALGHYAKRALAIEQTYGSPEWHLRRFTALRTAA